MKNFFLSALLLNLFLLGSCSSVCPNKNKSFERYRAELASLLAMIRSEQPDTGLIQESVLTLMDLSEPIYVQFVKKAPDCRDLLKQILDHREKMLLIDLESIECDYHDGEILVSGPDHCYHAKELVVHPATVYLLAKETFTPAIREAMLDELIELDSHMGEFLKDKES